MKMSIKRQSLARAVLISSVLLFLIISSLASADLEATYTENSNPVIQNIGTLGLTGSHNNYDVGFKIGELMINATDPANPPAFEKLELNRSGFGHKKKSKLVSTQAIKSKTEFDAKLVVRITYCGSRTRERSIRDDDDELLDEDDDNVCSNPYPITLEFFMLIKGIEDKTEADGIGFQFKDGQGPGNFKLDFEGDDDFVIPVDGNTGRVPIIPPEFTDGSGSSFINIQEIDKTWDASLFVDQSATGTLFDLTSELGSPSGAIVGSATIVLGGYSEHPEYSVEVTFEDAYRGIGDNSFNLKHEAIGSYIPFSLFLAGDEITNGEPFIWPSLGFAPISNQKNLIVKVNYYDTLSKIAGKYADTIYVTIAPHETNPFTF